MNHVQTNQARHLKRLQAYIGKMPSLSTTVIKVLETCNDPKASASDLKRVVSLDPVLTGQVLKLINSAYYSLAIPITSLARAIIMLGVNTVKNLALSFAILKNIGGSGSDHAFTTDEFWTHCLCVGVVAKLLAAAIGFSPTQREEFFVAGLLHDLGKVPLNTQFPQDYCRISEMTKTDQLALHQGEERFLGIDHGTVGNMIAKKWNLGMALKESLSHHHNLDAISADHRDFVFVVSLANQYTIQLNIGTAGDRYADAELISYLIEQVGVDWETLNDMRETVLSEIEKAKIFLEIAKKG